MFFSWFQVCTEALTHNCFANKRFLLSGSLQRTPLLGLILLRSLIFLLRVLFCYPCPVTTWSLAGLSKTSSWSPKRASIEVLLSNLRLVIQRPELRTAVHFHLHYGCDFFQYVGLACLYALDPLHPILSQVHCPIALRSTHSVFFFTCRLFSSVCALTFVCSNLSFVLCILVRLALPPFSSSLMSSLLI